MGWMQHCSVWSWDRLYMVGIIKATVEQCIFGLIYWVGRNVVNCTKVDCTPI